MPYRNDSPTDIDTPVGPTPTCRKGTSRGGSYRADLAAWASRAGGRGHDEHEPTTSLETPI